MRLGVCAGYEKAELIKSIGFDYFEYNLVSVYNLSDDEMHEAERIVNKLDFYSETMGIMLPTHMKIVGNHVNTSQVMAYLNKALERAERLGCKKIVFGSSHSRNMPHDFYDKHSAYSQIAGFLGNVAEILDKKGMELVIEPCPIHENNILTTIPEAYYVMHMVDKPNVKIMADVYTMQFAHERLGVLEAYADAVNHIHLSSPTRRIPCPWDGFEYDMIFSSLKRMKYDNTLTIEAFHYDDFEERVEGAYKLLSVLK